VEGTRSKAVLWLASQCVPMGRVTSARFVQSLGRVFGGISAIETSGPSTLSSVNVGEVSSAVVLAHISSNAPAGDSAR